MAVQVCNVVSSLRVAHAVVLALIALGDSPAAQAAGQGSDAGAPPLLFPPRAAPARPNEFTYLVQWGRLR
jgi:hypothetical protein